MGQQLDLQQMNYNLIKLFLVYELVYLMHVKYL